VTSTFRCSASSAALAEPMAGTASTVRSFLLLEVPGPWGVDALRDGRLPAELSAELERRCEGLGIRPLLVRRHGRTRTRQTRCFGAYADPHRPGMEAATLDRPEDVLDVPLDRLGRGESMGLRAHPEPLFLVCTHGRHDVCCAEHGRPIAAALAASYPQLTWECSHIGGDRFAGNIVVLPDGLYYGRADSHSGPRIAKTHLAGRLDLDHLRGRAGFRFPTQAAEWHLRRRLDLTGTSQLRLERERIGADVTEVVFAVHAVGAVGAVGAAGAVEGSGRWRVRVRTGRGEPCQLTCRVERPQRPLRFELLDIEPAGTPAR
jgi:hypothetical protein